MKSTNELANEFVARVLRAAGVRVFKQDVFSGFAVEIPAHAKEISVAALSEEYNPIWHPPVSELTITIKATIYKHQP